MALSALLDVGAVEGVVVADDLVDDVAVGAHVPAEAREAGEDPGAQAQRVLGRVAEAVQSTIRTGEPVFLIDIDIDRFKQVNEAIGFAKGDELVRAFARRLKASLPDNVVIGRIGAGEFAVLYPDTYFNMSMDVIAERLIAELMEPYDLTTHQQSVSVSVGIVAMPKDGDDPVLLLRRSNLALQAARAAGIGNWTVFHPDIGRVADYRQWIEAELHTAFQRGDFDRFADNIKSGKAWRDAWRTANDGFEQFVFEAKKTAERIDREYAVSRRLSSAASSAGDRAREIDREYGISPRVRTLSADFSRNFPKVNRKALDSDITEKEMTS